LRYSPARTARAVLFASAAVGLVSTLIAVLARPLTGRERRLPALVAALVGLQLVLHAVFLFASTGQLAHAGSAGLICSPSAAAGAASCLPTERGGWLLLAVQIVAAVLIAGWLRDVESAAWNLARLSGRGFSHLLGGLARVLAALVALDVAVRAALSTDSPVRWVAHRREPAAARLERALFSRSTGRRGPPSPARRSRVSRFEPRAGFPAATPHRPSGTLAMS
jgi:hypothetical protein